MADQATVDIADQSGAKTGKYLTFGLGVGEYGIETSAVREIIGMMDMTPVPNVPPCSARLRRTPPQVARRHFNVRRDRSRQLYRVKEHIRQKVNFACLNLMSPWPMTGPFDAIFCRNVMIYFDKTIQAQLIRRFWDQLGPGGLLFVGHSESLTGVAHGFRYVEPTVYEKP